jgi:hypothetical protein
LTAQITPSALLLGTWFLLVHVDDFITAAPTDEEVEQSSQQVKGEFEIKDMGEPSRFPGSAVSHCDFALQSRKVALYAQGVLRIQGFGEDCEILLFLLFLFW